MCDLQWKQRSALLAVNFGSAISSVSMVFKFTPILSHTNTFCNLCRPFELLCRLSRPNAYTGQNVFSAERIDRRLQKKRTIHPAGVRNNNLTQLPEHFLKRIVTFLEIHFVKKVIIMRHPCKLSLSLDHPKLSEHLLKYGPDLEYTFGKNKHFCLKQHETYRPKYSVLHFSQTS